MESLADRLIALHDLHVRGLLTDLEFALLKAREIERFPAPSRPPAAGAPASAAPAGTQDGKPRRTLNPVVPAVGLGLAAGAIAAGGLTS
jgi:hypothetical protein